MPSRPAARHSRTGSPVGSAAATSSSRWVAAGRASNRRRKLSSIRCDSARPSSGRRNPPPGSASVRPSGSSSSASGLPPVSAMIRSRTRSSSGTRITEPSSSRAASADRPRTSSSGKPPKSPPGSRAAASNPTGSASSLRATNASTWDDARSSHCESSITHSSGRCSATADSRLSTARPTRNRSGASPSRNPNATPSAARCGPGNRSSSPSIGAHTWCRAANASSISDSTPDTRAMPRPAAHSMAYSSSAVLPTPGSPRSTSTPLRPPRTASSRLSSAARSALRFSSTADPTYLYRGLLPR